MITRNLLCTGWVIASLSSAAQAHDMNHSSSFASFQLDRLEWRQHGHASWEGHGWLGDEINKAWINTEGEKENGELHSAYLELQYSRAISAFWDMRTGLRHDVSTPHRPARNWAALAFKGIAPYMINVDASVYLGNGMAARLKANYDLLITQKLIFQPELEANLYGKSDWERDLGSGLSNLDVSLRLRYQVHPEFAPYLGVVWSNRYGTTANLARASGEEPNSFAAVAGVRLAW